MRSNRLDERKFIKEFLKLGAALSILIGVVVLIFFIFKVSESHPLPRTGDILDRTHFGAFRDFIAGAVRTFFSLT